MNRARSLISASLLILFAAIWTVPASAENKETTPTKVPQTAASEPQQVFLMVDAFLQQSGSGTPVHLTHPVSERGKYWNRFRLGQDFRVWIDIVLKPGMTSPCDRRNDYPCIVRFELIGKSDGKDAVFTLWTPSPHRITNDISQSIPGIISRKIDPGAAIIRHSILAPNGTVVFNYEIPIVVE